MGGVGTSGLPCAIQLSHEAPVMGTGCHARAHGCSSMDMVGRGCTDAVPSHDSQGTSAGRKSPSGAHRVHG